MQFRITNWKTIGNGYRWRVWRNRRWRMAKWEWRDVSIDLGHNHGAAGYTQRWMLIIVSWRMLGWRRLALKSNLLVVNIFDDDCRCWLQISHGHFLTEFKTDHDTKYIVKTKRISTYPGQMMHVKTCKKNTTNWRTLSLLFTTSRNASDWLKSNQIASRGGGCRSLISKVFSHPQWRVKGMGSINLESKRKPGNSGYN